MLLPSLIERATRLNKVFFILTELLPSNYWQNKSDIKIHLHQFVPQRWRKILTVNESELPVFRYYNSHTYYSSLQSLTVNFKATELHRDQETA